MEDNDFIYETISLLNRIAKVNDGVLKSFELALEDKRDSYSILYSLLALVIVSNAKEDVAAVTAYQKRDSINFFYTKNDLSQSTINHVEKLASLAKTAAWDTKMKSIEFNKTFIRHVFAHCKPKIQRRLFDLRDRLTKTKPPTDIVPSTYDDLLSLYKSLESDPSINHAPKSMADKEACRYSEKRNLFDGLYQTLRSLRHEVTTDEVGALSADTFLGLSMHCYVVGYASVNLDIASKSPNLVPIMRACQKVGDYYRCGHRLFRSISESAASRLRFRNLVVQFIASPDELQKKIEPNYWHVLECVWWRQKGTFLPITRGQFLAKYQKGIQQYGKWPTQKFVAHAEITLITELVDKYRFTPTVIGVSKSCCAICTTFIEEVNHLRANKKLTEWHLPGSHGNHYNVQVPSVMDLSLRAGVDHLMKYLQDKLVQLIEDCIPPNASETPPYWSSSETEYSPEGHHFPIWKGQS
jgi:OTT_1508-like deaminase